MANFADNILKLLFLYELIFYMNLFRPFADIFKFMSWNIFFIVNELLLKFVPDSHQLAIVKSPLVHIMAWRQIGDKPLHEPILTNVTDAVYLHQTTIWLIISSFTEFKLVPISRVMISNQFSEWQQQNIYKGNFLLIIGELSHQKWRTHSCTWHGSITSVSIALTLMGIMTHICVSEMYNHCFT